jgi:tripartite-type tricarboxylate transporter receptor subunit TctC
MTHLTAEMLKIQAGIEMTHVVYRAAHVFAKAPMLRYALMINGVSSLVVHFKNGRLRPLATGSMKRLPMIPDVPTFGEQGSDLQGVEWYVLLAPAGTPRPIITKLNAELRKIMAQPGLGDKLVGVDLQSSSPEEAKAYIKSEIERWAPVIRKLGLKPE